MSNNNDILKVAKDILNYESAKINLNDNNEEKISDIIIIKIFDKLDEYGNNIVSFSSQSKDDKFVSNALYSCLEQIENKDNDNESEFKKLNLNNDNDGEQDAYFNKVMVELPYKISLKYANRSIEFEIKDEGIETKIKNSNIIDTFTVDLLALIRNTYFYNNY